ncbi:MAG: polyamine ABC transporter substrate-binding protein [Devosiaceae bacterium]|nr:polyamine ABC transporter substrate-binding protein [Devosiaceae bacterium MH13]
MRSNRLVLSTLAGLLIAGTSLSAQAREVRIYNWSDYIDESILEQFEAETGIEVTYDVFDSNEVLETRLLAGQTGYDIVVPTGTFLARQIQAGVFQELNKDALPNLENMWGDIEERMELYDPGNAYSINYMWGTTGLGVNVDMVQERLGADFDYNTWDLVFNPEIAAQLQDCGIFWLDAPTEMIPAALNYLGLDPRSTDPDEIAQATEMMMTARDSVQKFHNSENINALANGDICVAVGWSGDMLIARDRAAEADNGVNVEYLIPQEGALMWFDQMAIPADAPNVEEAHEFLNFIMAAENIAAASNYVYYANGNLASQPLLNDDVIGDTAIYPDEETVGRLYTILPYDPRTQRVVTRSWTTVKTGQ